MKLTKILLALFLLGFVVACSDDDNGKIDIGPIPLSEWTGSWNDPSHPNYRPDGYNPLEGKWKMIKENGLPVNKDNKCLYEFTSDFILKIYKNEAYQSGNNYQLNNEQVYIFRFTADKDVLYKYRFQMENGVNILIISTGERTYHFTPENDK